MQNHVLGPFVEGNDTIVFYSDEASLWQLFLKCFRKLLVLISLEFVVVWKWKQF